ncbi:DUF6119 family protein [Microbispora sp. H10836]|uniref:DUF6119 family protein n=1 Tax=Microbispora sp. H10836 TaxID=2729106 RepID=UPI001474C519|nr:DUF6119 family protein [Microbispora sp. H10836]
MKLNIFLIPMENIARLREKIEAAGMERIYQGEVDDWIMEFYFSTTPDPIEIPWAKDFATELASLPEIPKNEMHYGAYLWRSEEACFAISFGKSHFYLREFCDSDFGLSMAKRIGDKDDVRQKAARRYAGRSTKQIRSYRRESTLDLESGESIDYLHAATRESEIWGAWAKFGSSLLLSLTLDKDDSLAALLGRILEELKKPELFALPRTEIVKDKALIERYDRELIEAIVSEGAEFEEAAHQLVGVDFVFASNEHYYFQRRRAVSSELGRLDRHELREFIIQNGIRKDQIFDIKIVVVREDSRKYSHPIKKSLEYSIADQKVFLRAGEWVQFNEDYARFLDEYIDNTIEIDQTLEPDLLEIDLAEPDFNDQFNNQLKNRGYEVADTDLTILTLRNYKIEAWDLKKGKTVYAVKFGSAQKLGYVCDQAANVLEIYRNEPAAFRDIDIDTYCLWLGFALARIPERLSDINSIIFKQKLEAWARKCQTMNIKPMVRISRKIPSS